MTILFLKKMNILSNLQWKFAVYKEPFVITGSTGNKIPFLKMRNNLFN